MRDVAKAIAAVITVAAITVGAPLALRAWGSLSGLETLWHPHRWLSVGDGALITAICTSVGWGAWVLACASLVSEAVAQLGGVRPRLPGVGLFAPVSAALVAAIAGLASAPAAPAAVADEPPVSDTQTQSSQSTHEARTHLVVAGDDLWSLAERYTGDGLRWREIAELNSSLILNSNEITPGMVLVLPDAPTQPSHEITIAEGDTLRLIAARELGDAEAWPAIAEANSDSISDPNLIHAGATLLIPSPTAKPDETPPTQSPTPQPTQHTPAPPDTSHDHAGGSATVHSEAGNLDLDVALGAVLAGLVFAAFGVRRYGQAQRRPRGATLPRIPAEAIPALASLGRAAAVTQPLDAPDLVVGYHDGTPVTWAFDEPRVRIVGDREEAVGFACALALAASCAGTRTIVVGQEFSWLSSLDEPETLVFFSPGEAAAQLRDEIQARGAAQGIPSRSIVISSDPLDVEVPAGLGLSVVECGETGVGPEFNLAQPQSLTPAGQRFTHSVLTPPARRALVEIFDAALSEDYGEPWWSEGRDEIASGPVLAMLGPIELSGAAGTPPSRAAATCLEYCGWLLDHAESTAAQMSAELLVAEGTRRSNVSRLRRWLGSAPDGSLYLPEAYDGTVRLRGVTSDWARLRALVPEGANAADDETLRRALNIVRGEPLADAAPGQWVWAEQMRQDMIAAIIDIGLTLAERALAGGRHDLATWALDKAMLADARNERVMVARIKLADSQGRRDTVDALALDLVRNARILGLDLCPDTVAVLQQTIEGTTRRIA